MIFANRTVNLVDVNALIFTLFQAKDCLLVIQ